MSPSHQDRVRQNYCDHLVARLQSDLGIFELCLKCGKKKETFNVKVNPLPDQQSPAEVTSYAHKPEHPDQTYQDQPKEVVMDLPDKDRKCPE